MVQAHTAEAVSLTPWQERLTELAAAPHDPDPARAEECSNEAPEDASSDPPLSPESQAEALLRQAGETADRIVTEARVQAEGIAMQAREQAMRLVAQEQQAALEQFLAALQDSIGQKLAEHMRRLEVDVTRLCVSLTEKVIRRHVAQDDDIVVQTVREGLEQLTGAGTITIHVHPDSAEALEGARGRLAARGVLPDAIIISPDEHIEPGGAVLTGEGGEVDLQIGTQLRALEAAVETALEAELAGEAKP